MPGFLANIEAIKGKGVDTVACISVNDAFVMGAWGKSQQTGDKILMLGDGSGEFSQAMGLTMDLTKNGLGMRSQRYAALVRDGVVVEIKVDEKPWLAEASSAESICHL